MTIAGTHPEKGIRVALDLEHEGEAHVRYRGDAFLPGVKFAVAIEVARANGDTRVEVGERTLVGDVADAPQALERGDRSFLEQLGKQAFRLATETPPEEGGGRWPRRIQRWRGPK
jgi:hypothetical protein